MAPSWEERHDRGEYKFALVAEDEIVESKARAADKRKEAYIFLGKVEGSQKKMRDFLRVYGKKVSQNASPDFLKGEIDSLIEEPVSLSKVLDIINDPDYEMKLFLEDAVDCGAVKKRSKKYYLQGGDPINENEPTLAGTIEQLKLYKKNTDDIYLRIDNQIKNSLN